MVSIKAAERAILAFSFSGIRPTFNINNADERLLAARFLADCLQDISDADLGEATRAYLRSGERFWPTPGALLEAVNGPSSASGEAVLAWAKLLQKRQEDPRWRPLKADSSEWFLCDALTHNRLAVARMQGWTKDHAERDLPMSSPRLRVLFGGDSAWFADHGVPETVYLEMLDRIESHASKPGEFSSATAPARLSGDPDTEAAIWAGIWAVGGWRAEVFVAESPTGVGFARSAFCKAYTESLSGSSTALQVMG